MSLEVQNVSKVFGAQRAVDHLSFSAKKGEILGFLGPNGAGKSTTMKMATTYFVPTEGTISVAGYDVETQPAEVRNHVGYLPEHNPLYLDMYVHEYLAFIGQVHKIKGNALSSRVKEMIDLCGLGVEQNKLIGQLSKGYRQRVGLAQALIHNPPVLILDEPTTGLDPNQILEIRQVIKEIGKEKTVVFSTHIMQEVTAICERVIIINKGKKVADSTVKELGKQAKGQTYVVLEFSEEMSSFAGLDKMKEVVNIETMDARKIRLTIDADKDIRPSLLKLAGENSWPLLGIQQEENSLENIFKELTQETVS
ncbi:gliding motility-associated ABC transporter ATP-binding subunit GldA [uncultured Imperialibacter sp.]|uniref:gliding motility-associated ABC transporter ATP-binding subunit GldA n=1 Tax=uncultured Imperialibacter sp. TaxID=1672639 RepID=UPI0030D7B644|tara:strand:- start:23096 stop:24022 length:927 start_codon:yes stop_codon:yes gene_type:complete